MCVDWYTICPEQYYEIAKPEIDPPIDLADPVNNTYILLYVTDTYESWYGETHSMSEAAQRLLSIQRWFIYDNNDNVFSTTDLIFCSLKGFPNISTIS